MVNWPWLEVNSSGDEYTDSGDGYYYINPDETTLTLVIGIKTLMMVRGNSGYGYTHPSDGHTDPGDMYSGDGYTDSSYVFKDPGDGHTYLSEGSWIDLQVVGVLNHLPPNSWQEKKNKINYTSLPYYFWIFKIETKLRCL